MTLRRPLVRVGGETAQLPDGDQLLGVPRVRRRRVRFEVSDASVPIPLWAQGGQGTVYVTGTGGGASGGLNRQATQRGPGGCSGAYAVRHPIQIPAGVTTVSVVIGTGGTPRSASTGAAQLGNPGGYSEVAVGSRSLRLSGGNASAESTGAVASYLAPPLVDGQVFENSMVPRSLLSSNSSAGYSAFPPFPNLGSTLFFGHHGGDGSSDIGGYGAGGWSPFGKGGRGYSTISTVTQGENASGFGAGGAGAGGAAAAGTLLVSGAGAPGFIELEFEECPND